jgi:hypothetical protein
MRPIPWMVRLGLFALGFGIGLSRYQSNVPQRAIVIEVRNPTQSTDFIEPRAAAAAMPHRERECRPSLLDNNPLLRTANTARLKAPSADKRSRL